MKLILYILAIIYIKHLIQKYKLQLYILGVIIYHRFLKKFD
jgi:hypothetical protein